MEFPQNIKNGAASRPSDSASGHLSKETRNTDLREYTQLHIHCSVISDNQDLKATQVSIYRQVDKKKSVVHTCNGILLSYKKEQNLQQHG